MDECHHSDYVIYADESGDLSIKNLYKDYPIFLLALCIFSKQEYITEVVRHINNFKFFVWGHDMTVLHSAKIRKQIEDFYFLQNQNKRKAFMESLSETIQNCPFTVISTGIDKRLLKEKYSKPAHPYELSLEYCLERVYRFLREKGQNGKVTYIILEARMPKENKELETAFLRIIDKNKIMQMQYPLKIIFAEKKVNNIGLQIADLIAYPIGRFLVNQKEKNPAFEIIERKFHKYPDYLGKGLKIFPDQGKAHVPEKRKAPEYSEA